MAWQKRPHLTTLRQALSLALFGSFCTMGIGHISHAVTLGKTSVYSAQHEPLNASISVSGIEADNFSADLVSSDIYKQMGLQPNDSMSVRFVPNGSNSGQIVISTSRPISAPFTDVVLSIRDGDERQVVPKTLLMPLGKSAKPVDTSRQVTGKATPNLPTVSRSEASTPIAKPLAVSRSAPPPLLPSTNLPNNQSANSELPSSNSNSTTLATSNSLSSNAMANVSSEIRSNDARTALSSQSSSVNTSVVASAPEQQPSSVTNAIANDQANQQLDIINIEITRTVRPSQGSNSSDALSASTTDITDANSNIDNSTDTDDQTMANDTAQTPSASAAEPTPDQSSPATTVVAEAAPSDNLSEVSYTVQRNDSLWSIANALAAQNNIDVHTVMQQLYKLNPDAFINRDIDKLRADAQLNLPKYETIPSQSSLQAAIKARRDRFNARKAARSESETTQKKQPVDSKAKATAKSKSDKKAVTAKSPRSTKAASKAKSTSRPVTKSLPKARMTVLAPGQSGQADGVQTKTSAATGSGIDTDLLATLKSSRQRTANQAKRVREISQQVSSYNKKLQLQNQKLAELEAHLKKLRQK